MTGRHFFSVFYTCRKNVELLDNTTGLEKLSRKIIEKSNMTLFNIATKHFKPQGITLLAIIGESHFSIHTYPELKGCIIDILTCGNEGDPRKGIEFLKKYLDPEEVEENYFTF